ncbi:hypothetical protein C2S53_018692 [Perilla frutescens var. hirtella]|uniref:Cystatin domain-containing protein n=1 Tax=Perilla frutescens var. hirtella TaxID=608512 RepID=A0AAD4IR57_PERFH|nr:hypothetical protein C2S53_018692 [Perilla frutescens var. hirtella]
MAPKSAHILFAFLSLLAVAVPILAASRGPLLGGWQPIHKPNAISEVADAAKFAVEDYNKKQNKSLIFVSVVKGESQVVAGTKYRLIISAKDGAAAAPHNYRAVVWYKVVEKTLHLISFQKETKA